MAAIVVATRSRRSCEHTTAFGAPVVPEVNSRKIWSDGFTLVVGSGASAYGARVSSYAGSSTTRTRPSAAPRSRPSSSSRWRRLGDDELALGVVDVALEAFAAARGVDADDRRRAHRGGTRPHREVGEVLEQETDVRRAVDAHRLEQRGPRRARAHPLVVGPRLVFEEQGDVRIARRALVTRSAKTRPFTVR